MDNYKSNSHKSKEAEKERVEKRAHNVVTGVAKVKQPSAISKFAKTFISEDASKVGSHIVTEVIVPGIAKILTDSLQDCIDIIFKGGSSRNRRNSGNYPGNYVSYNNYSNNSKPAAAPAQSKQVHSPSDITLASRRDAEAVLNQMRDILTQYGAVSVNDLYDSVGLTGSYTDAKYGWTDLRNATVARDGDGWYIKFPNAYPLTR